MYNSDFDTVVSSMVNTSNIANTQKNVSTKRQFTVYSLYNIYFSCLKIKNGWKNETVKRFMKKTNIKHKKTFFTSMMYAIITVTDS